MDSTVEQLAAQYRSASHTFSTVPLGDRTDRAWERMERIVTRAENLGIFPQLAAELGIRI